MSALSQRAGISLLMLLASMFASNHIAARLAFDHGTSVASAVGVRSGATALCGLVLALDVVGSARGRRALGADRHRGRIRVRRRVRVRIRGGAVSHHAAVVSGIGATAHELALPADREGWFGLVLLTLLYGTAITAVFTVVPCLKAASSTVVLNFEPVMALFLGWVILGQAVAPSQIFGAFLVVGAIIYLSAGRR